MNRYAVTYELPNGKLKTYHCVEGKNENEAVRNANTRFQWDKGFWPGQDPVKIEEEFYC